MKLKTLEEAMSPSTQRKRPDIIQDGDKLTFTCNEAFYVRCVQCGLVKQGSSGELAVMYIRHSCVVCEGCAR